MKSRLLGAVCACLIGLSFNASAIVLNTLNGIDYEWLELTATDGMSRDEVEAQLSDSNSLFYGYEYASRGLVEDLFLSYSSWDSITGFHRDSSVVNALQLYQDDFGPTRTAGGGIFTDTDGIQFYYGASNQTMGLYGTTDECGVGQSCVSNLAITYDDFGLPPTSAHQGAYTGWSAASTIFGFQSNGASDNLVGSHLVRAASAASPVPVPAAAWLFGSGLLGLVGIARRKKAA